MMSWEDHTKLKALADEVVTVQGAIDVLTAVAEHAHEIGGEQTHVVADKVMLALIKHMVGRKSYEAIAALHDELAGWYA